MSSFHSQYRTHTCNELRMSHEGKTAKLSGWLRNRRDHGGVLFLELADHFGVTQIVVDPEQSSFPKLAQLNKETVLSVEGTVVRRDAKNLNPKIPTGEVELHLNSYEVLSSCDPLPFPIFPDSPAPEDLRLTYRFLDLRRSRMQSNITLRSHIIASMRKRMWEFGFMEFQTPTLTASSPEGARDFLVPSRKHPGKFYALPQAPQQFKQLLMTSGFDRYFQIAPCYRDEDARADRSPGEFYQLDIEMSFVTQEDVFRVTEELLAGLFLEFLPNTNITSTPFLRISYQDALMRYGNDKPDLRNPLQITDLTDLFVDSPFRAFSGKIVRCIAAPALDKKSRSFFDKLEEQAKDLGAPGLAWILLGETTATGPIAKFLSTELLSEIRARTQAQTGDGIFFSADEKISKICNILSFLRDQLGQQLDLIEKGSFRFCWIVDFPMFEWNEENQKIDFSHNPFSMPQGGLAALEKEDPLSVKAYQYDIVCNGIELSSGAIRNHSLEIMYRAFEIAGYPTNIVDQQFGALTKAFRYGVPPHGGIAPGIDRIVMLIANEPNIREVIAFPLSQQAEDLLMGAPSTVRPEQLRELKLACLASK